jgi:hypothetical protein
METLKHILGICGEPHINIYTIIVFLIINKILFFIFFKNRKLNLK